MLEIANDVMFDFTIRVMEKAAQGCIFATATLTFLCVKYCPIEIPVKNMT